MDEDKPFLTYNQQMKKLRRDKSIACSGSKHKQILVRAGYFNIINGYKSPFVCGQDSGGNHIYLPDSSIDQIYVVKKFDDDLRSFLLKYITQIEEEIRTLAAYKFDQCNDNGKIPWYSPDAYNPQESLKNKMEFVSDAYKQLSGNQSDYVKFYMNNHQQIPTWIMTKVINFSTFIYFLQNCKQDVPHSLCELYEMYDNNGKPNVKLLIGSLHWLRIVRNSCAHNERVYCICRDSNSNQKNTGRIIETYFRQLRPSYYRNSTSQRLMDLFVYFKYYLPNSEYRKFITTLLNKMDDLQNSIMPDAFNYIRGKMGIKDLNDLIELKNLHKDEIDYNSFERL